MMREMRESGNTYIGIVPASWKVTKLKRLRDENDQYPIGDGDHGAIKPEDYIDEGVPYIRVQNLSWSDKLKFDDIVYISTEVSKRSAKSELKPGDILVAKTGATIGKTAIIPDDMAIANTTSSVGKITVDKKFNKRYVYYLLRSDALINQMWDSARQKSAQPGFNIDELTEYSVCIPSRKEQDKIVNFLDEKLFYLDTVISKIKESIEEYKRFKQSTITEAVTNGLDPNVEMKDSGIEWIGKHPTSWITLQIKYASWLKGRIGWDGLKSTEYTEEGPYLITGTDFKNGSIDWDSCVHITKERYDEDELLHIQESDLLITKDGTVGKLAIVKNCPKEVSLNSGVLLIRNNRQYKYDSKYLYYVLMSNQFKLWYELSNVGNSTIKHLYQQQFYDFEFTYPSIKEQEQISKYLDNQCAKIERIIIKKEQVMTELEKYKKSLIYEYVTGKKELI